MNVTGHQHVLDEAKNRGLRWSCSWRCCIDSLI